MNYETRQLEMAKLEEFQAGGEDAVVRRVRRVYKGTSVQVCDCGRRVEKAGESVVFDRLPLDMIGGVSVLIAGLAKKDDLPPECQGRLAGGKPCEAAKRLGV